MDQAENIVVIKGILSEVGIKEGSFRKDGQDNPYIGGSIKVLVNQDIAGVPYEMEVPISVFATKFKKDGKENPAYKSLKDVMDNFVSIAAAGDINKADHVCITRGTLKENSFCPEGKDQVVTTTKLEATFINKINKNECIPEATFHGVIVIGNKVDEVDKEGNPTGRLIINGIIPQYGGRLDMVKYVVSNEQAINHINSYWHDGDTVKIQGKMNYSSKTEFVVEEMGFGEPIKTAKTTSVKDLIITSGSPAGLGSELSYNLDEIRVGLAERRERLNKLKPTPKVSTKHTEADLGF